MAFSTPVRRATGVSSTSNASSWTPSWTFSTNTAISSGEKVLWVAVITADGNGTLTETGGQGWSKKIHLLL
jgi:hypothetical protein